jgi:hypothetical protein
MHVCPCGTVETVAAPFYKKSAVCRACYVKKKASGSRIRCSQRSFRDRQNLAERARRADPSFRSKFILRDSRATDLKIGRANDLSLDFVELLISTGCAYCGATQLKMTLDRKDNRIGHVRTNVMPCCVRCNLIRRDMPYEAWLVVVAAIRQAREAGLFGDWTCEISRGRGSI